MIIKIRKFVAKVAEFNEHEDGSISKDVKEIVLKGQRFSPSAVERHIPRGEILIESGWRESSYEVDTDKLENFCKENGKLIVAETK